MQNILRKSLQLPILVVSSLLLLRSSSVPRIISILNTHYELHLPLLSVNRASESS